MFQAIPAMPRLCRSVGDGRCADHLCSLWDASNALVGTTLIGANFCQWSVQRALCTTRDSYKYSVDALLLSFCPRAIFTLGNFALHSAPLANVRVEN